MLLKERAGRYVSQTTGYKAFVPDALPPKPPLEYDSKLLDLLSQADRALGKLDGAAEVLPNVDLFVAMYVRNEAVLSSQIEGTQASLADILEFEAKAPERLLPSDVHEVYNYVRALNYGLDRLRTLPLSLRLIGEIHGELMRGVRGSQRTPGEFRRSQNWIGPPGCLLKDAVFVPPALQDMQVALGDLEKFIHDSAPIPALVKCGLIHCQFETIHPFLDGNGRVGRLLITFMLCAQGVLKKPLLYLSLYFKQRRAEYYDRLMAVRDAGDWEGWIEFFLRGVREVSAQATLTAQNILELQRRHQELLQKRVPGSVTSLKLLDLLFRNPVVSAHQVARRLNVSYPTANNLLSRLEKLRLLREVTGHKRNRFFSYDPYLNLFKQLQTPQLGPDQPVQTSLFVG